MKPERQSYALINAQIAHNMILRANAKATLVYIEKGGHKHYYLRIDNLDYWIPSADVMTGLGYGRLDENGNIDAYYHMGRKVTKINEA